MHDRRPPLTQQAIAERVGVSQTAVSDWLNKGRMPRADALNTLSAELGVHKQWLLTGEGDKELPAIYITHELPTGRTRRQKVAFIEDKFPEALPTLDSLLDTLCKEIGSMSARSRESAPSKKGRRFSYLDERSDRRSRSSR